MWAISEDLKQNTTWGKATVPTGNISLGAGYCRTKQQLERSLAGHTASNNNTKYYFLSLFGVTGSAVAHTSVTCGFKPCLSMSVRTFIFYFVLLLLSLVVVVVVNRAVLMHGYVGHLPRGRTSIGASC